MTKTGKIIVAIIVLIIIVWVVVANTGGKEIDNKSITQEPIKIGLSLPLTGDLGFIGETDKNAALLAIDEINAQANLKNKYELVIEDDAFSAQKGASSLNKLITVDKVKALVSVGSIVGNVATPIAESSKIPHIGMASDANVAKGDFNFIHSTQPQEEVTALVTELKKRALTKVAVIGVNQQGFVAIEQDFKTKAAAAGITILADETFNPGQTDFKTLISKVQKTNPQIYLLNAFDPEIGIIVKQIKALGIKTPLTSVESFGISADPKQFEGQWFIDSAIPAGTFVQNYRAKYQKEPGPAAANTYDAVKLFVQAFETAPSASGEDVTKTLAQIQNYSGALGDLSLNADGVFISQASVKVIKDGKAEIVK